MSKQSQKASYTKSKLLQALDMQLHRSLVVKTQNGQGGLSMNIFKAA